MIRRMLFKHPQVLSIVAAVFKDRADLVAENIALCHHEDARPHIPPPRGE